MQKAFEADMAAMPAWDLEAWLDSLGMQRLVTKSVLGRVQASLDGRSDEKNVE